jgi:hypothetical protein
MEFLNINVTKDLSLHTIHSLFYWQILKKTILFSLVLKSLQKICEPRKLESIHE